MVRQLLQFSIESFVIVTNYGTSSLPNTVHGQHLCWTILPEGRLKACEYPVGRSNVWEDMKHRPPHRGQAWCSYRVQLDRERCKGRLSHGGNSAHGDTPLSGNHMLVLLFSAPPDVNRLICALTGVVMGCNCGCWE